MKEQVMKMQRNPVSKMLLVLAFLCVIEGTNGAKILTIFPIPFKEHQAVYRPLIENLLKQGHEITLLTTNPYFTTEYEYQNITEIDLSFVYNLDVLNELNDGDLEGSEMLKTVFKVMRKISEAELKSPKVQKLLNNVEESDYDLVLVEWSGSASLMNIFAHQFNTPLIAITNGDAFPNVHEAFGNPNHPISYPSVFLPFSENLNLLQRISSVLFTIWYRFYYFTEEIPLQNEIIRNVLSPEKVVPDLWEIECNADLLLINSYEVLGNVRPSVPTTVYLGGIHQQTNDRQMSPSLKQFIDESENIIYVNLNYGIHYYPQRLEKILYALESTNADVIWNWSSGIMVNTSARIYQGSDLEQESILAHPKVIMHITDGGQRNIEDTVHHSVPVLGISYSSTLEHYLYQIEKFQSGLISYIDFDSNMELADKLQEMQSNKRFKLNMYRLQNLIMDQPISNSVDRATWWIEYVIRNKGTKHLRNEHKTMSWFKYLMLDVLLAIVVGCATLITIFIYTLQKLRKYSNSLPFERVTRGSKCKVL